MSSKLNHLSHPTVDNDFSPYNERRIARSEKKHCFRNFLRRSKTFHWNLCLNSSCHLLKGFWWKTESFKDRCFNWSRTYDVDSNALPHIFGGQGSGEAYQGCLTRSVDTRSRHADMSIDCTIQDDATTVPEKRYKPFD